MNEEEPKREGGQTSGGASTTGEPKSSSTARRELLPLPGLAAISLYLLLVAVVLVVGVVRRDYSPVFLLLPVFLFAACGGLLLLLRWAWALALAAVLLLSGYNLWFFTRMHLVSTLIQGLLNLVFFLYLVRTEVRARLR